MCDEPQEKQKGFGVVVCLFIFFSLAIIKILTISTLAITNIFPVRDKIIKLYAAASIES